MLHGGGARRPCVMAGPPSQTLSHHDGHPTPQSAGEACERPFADLSSLSWASAVLGGSQVPAPPDLDAAPKVSHEEKCCLSSLLSRSLLVSSHHLNRKLHV